MPYTILTSTTSFPAQYPYQLINLTANITLGWATSFGTSIAAAGYNEITTSQDGYIITLPDATLASEGVDVIFSNLSSYNFVVNKSDGTTLYTVNAGVIVDLKLIDNSTTAGGWRIIPWVGGYSGIVSFTAQSSDNTIVITNGSVSPPGATINFQLPTSIKNLNNVSTTGFPIIKTTSPLTWGTVSITAGDNIEITNPDGINADPVINLNSSVAGLTYLQIGSLEMTGAELTTTVTDGSVAITSNGDGYVIINDVTIDTNGKMVINGELDVTGTFKSPFTPKAWCTFTDILNDTVHDITIQAQANISSVEFVSTGNYKINFTTALSSINYGVIITLGTTGGPSPFVSHGFYSVQETGYVTISIVDASGQLVSSVPNGATIMVMSL
jgi:hypothetical protein